MGETPVWAQYLRIKRRYPDALLLFRMGDFYETFDEDAQVAARVLEIALTSREMGKGRRVPLAGIPAVALEGYLARLIAGGHKVAICEQTTDPAASRGLLEREVVRVVTPGTVLEPELLPPTANNYLAAAVVEGGEAGIAYVDITTSEFATAQLPLDRLLPELERLAPAELLLPDGAPPFAGRWSGTVTPLEEGAFRLDVAQEALLQHFQVASLEAFGCAQLPLAIRAAGAVLHYLRQTQMGALSQVQGLATYSLGPYMSLDPQTVRNLELFQNSRLGGPGRSLLSVLDLTETPMGGRLLRRWLGQPLVDLGELQRRQEATAWLHGRTMRRARVRQCLDGMGDLERLVNRVRGGAAAPREVVALGRALEKAARLRQELQEGAEAGHPLHWLARELQDHTGVVALIGRALKEDPAPHPGEGEVVREGFSPELDELRLSSRDARSYIAALEAKERERTGIKSLKVGYNKVFGYYIEVTRPHLAHVPSDYIRKQTIAGGERYFTPELKEYEAHLLHAQDRLAELEAAIFRQVCRQAGEEAPRVLTTAAAAAGLDALAGLAEVAVRYNYVRPTLDEGDAIHVLEGRHPVVERALGGPFVPNDVRLSNGEAQLAILTGPNMSGKSTYLRQVALIVLMAQIGSFVPAQEAQIGLVDRVFTRVGLQDDLATGRSTFMVEMTETAAILHHATPRSLIILDEIGRGTSTYDGLSLAWAVAEYIHNHPRLGAKTLFATHYHELVELGDILPRAVNLRMDVAEEEGNVVFLRRVVPGGADRSYGVHVARLAGLPRPVIRRAEEVLAELEGGGRQGSRGETKAGPSPRRRGLPQQQLSLLPTPTPAPDPLRQEIAAMDLDGMTPLEALTRLYDLRKKARLTP